MKRLFEAFPAANWGGGTDDLPLLYMLSQIYNIAIDSNGEIAGMSVNIQGFAEFFKCLAEPVRLRILYLLLTHKELCVCDLVNGLGLSQSVVSRHLAYMRNNALLNTRREGVWIYYQLAVDLGPMASTVLDAFKLQGASCDQLNRDLKAIKSPMSACQ